MQFEASNSQLSTLDKEILISIVIPTFNSETTLKGCLDSIFQQNFENFELILTDGGSIDNTIEIAKTYDLRIINCCNSLLRSRKIGIEEARGHYILLMDSDQVLLPESLLRCYNKMKEGYDMLILEENPIEEFNKIMKMWSTEKSSNFLHFSQHKSPLDGSILPRFFDHSLLMRAVEQIPEPVLRIRHPDHQIIYYETYKLSQRIGYLEGVILYLERTEVQDLVKTYFMHGRDAAFLFFEGTYRNLITSKFINKSINTVENRNLLLSAYLNFLRSFPFFISFLINYIKYIALKAFKNLG